MKSLKIIFISCVLSILFFIKCGFVNKSSYENVNTNNQVSFNSTNNDDATPSTRPSRKSESFSSSKCRDDEDCKHKCFDMLELLQDQIKCYDLSESKVEKLYDIFDEIETPDDDDLDSITKKEWEDFLEFDPVLWVNSIKGFERNKKTSIEVEGRNTPLPCNTLNSNSADDQKEDCQEDDYYIKVGYSRDNAYHALQWIAKSPWLYNIIKKEDKDDLIITNLIDVIHDGGNQGTLEKELPKISTKYKTDITPVLIKNCLEIGVSVVPDPVPSEPTIEKKQECVDACTLAVPLGTSCPKS